MLFSIEKAIFAIGKLTSAIVDDLIISIQVGASCANLFVSQRVAWRLVGFCRLYSGGVLAANNVYKSLSVVGVLCLPGILAGKYAILACAVLKC